MKNLLLMLPILLVVVGCQKCPECKPCPPVAAQRMACSDDLNETVQQNAERWCTEDMTSDHLVTDTDYRIYLSNRWTEAPEPKFIYWNDIYALIDDVNCYDKFVQFTFGANASDNYSIRPVLVDCFDRNKSCYSVPFLKKIGENHRLGSGDVFECSIAKVGTHPESVVFAVMDHSPIVPVKRHYDVSNYPKTIQKRLDSLNTK